MNTLQLVGALFSAICKGDPTPDRFLLWGSVEAKAKQFSPTAAVTAVRSQYSRLLQTSSTFYSGLCKPGVRYCSGSEKTKSAAESQLRIDWELLDTEFSAKNKNLAGK